MMATMDGPAEIPEAARREAWLAERRTAITGTDAGKILTGKGLDVWLEKMGHGAPFDATTLPDFVQAGRYYERGTLAWYADREAAAIEFADSYLFRRHPDAAIPVGCTLDARRLDDGRPVDAKMIHRWSPYDAESGTGWGEFGSDQVPTLYAAQGTVQMAVMDAERMDFPVFFRVDGEFVIYRLVRDREREARLLAVLSGWWARHIVGGEQPAVDGSEAATEFLKRLARSTEIVRPAKPEEEVIARMLAVAKEDLAEIELEHDRLTNLLREATGADLGIMGSGWKFTHKANKPSAKVDWEAAARELARQCASDYETDADAGLDAAAKRILDPVIAKFTTLKESGRVARFTTTTREG